MKTVLSAVHLPRLPFIGPIHLSGSGAGARRQLPLPVLFGPGHFTFSAVEVHRSTGVRSIMRFCATGAPQSPPAMAAEVHKVHCQRAKLL